jgi:hypothetical protein
MSQLSTTQGLSLAICTKVLTFSRLVWHAGCKTVLLGKGRILNGASGELMLHARIAPVHEAKLELMRCARVTATGC